MPVFNDNFNIDNARLPSEYYNPAVEVQDTLEKFWTSRDYPVPESSGMSGLQGMSGLPSYLQPINGGMGDVDPDQMKSYLANSGQSADANPWMIEGESPIGMKIDFNSVYQMLSDGTYHRKQENVLDPATDRFRFAAQQTNGEKFMNGLSKMFSNAGGVFAQGVVGGIYGIGSAIAEGNTDRIWDNEVSNYFNDLMTVNNLDNQIWRDPNAKGGLASLGTVDFWADDFLSGIGFMAGAVGTEALFALTPVKGMSIASLGARAASLAKGVASGAAVARNLRTVASAAKSAKALGAVKNVARLGDMGSIMRMTATSTAAESSFEALQFRNDAVDKYFEDYKRANGGKIPSSEEIAEFDKSLKEAGNAVFAGNMFVTGLSNYLMFGKHLMGPGIRNAIDNATGAFTPKSFKRFMGVAADKEFAKGASKAVQEGAESTAKHLAGHSGKEVFKYGTKARVADFVLTTGGKALTEGVQEVSQGTLAKMGQEWLDSRYDPEYVGRSLSFAEAGSKALSEHYGTDDFWREFLAGAVVGVIGGKASDMMLGGQKLFEGSYGQQNRRLTQAYDNFVKNGGENIVKFADLVKKYGSEQFDRLGARLVSAGHMAKAYDKADEKLANGDLLGSHLSNAEAMFMFNFMSSMEQLGDSVGFSTRDMFHTQVNLLSSETFKKQYGVQDADINDVKNRMKSDFDKMQQRYEKSMSVARDVLRMADPKLSSLQLPLAVNIYKAGALTEVMRNVSEELSGFVNDQGLYFEGLLTLGDSLQDVLHELGVYEQERKDLEDEKAQLESELPKIDTSEKLDEVENQNSQKRRLDILDRLAVIEASLKDLEGKKYDLEVRINEVRDVDSNIISIMDDSLNLREGAANLRVEDLIGTFKALEKLDGIANELLMSDNMVNKQKGAYMKSLLKMYGEGLKTAQDINHIYTTFASPQNGTVVSSILQAFGQRTDGTVYENDSDTAVMDNILEAEGRRYGIDTKKASVEAQNVAKAILRSLIDKHSLREGRIQGEAYITEDGRDDWMPNRPYAYIREESEPITQEEMEDFYENGLYVTDSNGNVTSDVRPELKHVHDLLVHRQAHGIPLSRNQALILDYLELKHQDSKDSFDATVTRYKKGKYEVDFTTPDNNTAFDVNIENIARREAALTPRANDEEVTPEYLRRKVNNRLQNLRGFEGWQTSEAKELVKELTDEIIKTYLDLKSRQGTLTQDEENHLNEIEDKLRRISLLQGTETEDDSNLLEDLLLWNQLEELAISTGSAGGIIDPDDVETGVNHFDRNLRKGSGNRHYNILQNYSHVFAEGRDVNGVDMVAISNLTFVGLVDALGQPLVFTQGGNNPMSATDVDALSHEDFNNENVVISFHTNGGNIITIPLTMDRQRNILIEEAHVQTIQQVSPLRLDISTGSGTRYNAVRFQDANGDLTHLESDITVDSLVNGNVVRYRMDQTAVGEVRPGDKLRLVYPSNNVYNSTLDINDTNTFNSQSVIMVYDSQNRFVGVLKSYDGSTFDGQDFYDLRKAAIEAGRNSTIEVDTGLFDTGITIDADFIFTGHPNIMFNEDSNGDIVAVEKPFDVTVTDKVESLGYIERDPNDGELYIVSENGRVLYENGKHPYLQNIVSKNGGAKIIPFMVIKQNNVPVLYPLGLKPAQVNVSNQVLRIVNDTTLNNGEKARALNRLFHGYGISTSEVVFDVARVTDSNYIQEAIAKANLIDIYPDVREWFNGMRTKEEILLNDAITSLNLWDRPFNAPKIRFGLGGSPTGGNNTSSGGNNTTTTTSKNNKNKTNKNKNTNGNSSPNTGSGTSTSNSNIDLSIFDSFGNNIFNALPDTIQFFLGKYDKIVDFYKNIAPSVEEFNKSLLTHGEMFKSLFDKTDASNIRNLANLVDNYVNSREALFENAHKGYSDFLAFVETNLRQEIQSVETAINNVTDPTQKGLLENRLKHYNQFVTLVRNARVSLTKTNFVKFDRTHMEAVKLSAELRKAAKLLEDGKGLTDKKTEDIKGKIRASVDAIFAEQIKKRVVKKGDVNAWYAAMVQHLKPTTTTTTTTTKGTKKNTKKSAPTFDVLNPPDVEGVNLDGSYRYKETKQKLIDAKEAVKNAYDNYKSSKDNPKLRLKLRIALKDAFDAHLQTLLAYKATLKAVNTQAAKDMLNEVEQLIDNEDVAKAILDEYMEYITADNPMVQTVYSQLGKLIAENDDNPSKELQDKIDALREDVAHIENLIDSYLMDSRFGISRFKKPSVDTNYKFKAYSPSVENETSKEEEEENEEEEEDISDENDINVEEDEFQLPVLKSLITRLLNSKLARGLKWFTGPVELSPDADFHFIGINGIKNLQEVDKETYNIAMAGYDMALRMEYENWGKKGISDKVKLEIKRKTGWERGLDGKWRYEFSDFVFTEEALQGMFDGDSKTVLEVKKGSDKPIFENQDLLIEMYPGLEGYTISFNDKMDAHARVVPYSKKIEFKESTREARHVESLQSSIVHELQHVIQRGEGFTSGASSLLAKSVTRSLKGVMFDEALQAEIRKDFDAFVEDFITKYRIKKDTLIYKTIKQLRVRADENYDSPVLDKGKGYEESMDEAFRDPLVQFFRTNWSDMSQSRYSVVGLNTLLQKNKEKLKQAVEDDNKELIRLYRALNKRIRQHLAYELVLGEIEARNASYRMSMTEGERRNSLMSSTQSVPDKHAVHREDMNVRGKTLTLGRLYEENVNADHAFVKNALETNPDFGTGLPAPSNVETETENGAQQPPVTISPDTLGYVKDGVVYLNRSFLDMNNSKDAYGAMETAVHEYGHVWLNLIENQAVGLFEEGVRLAKEHPMFETIKNDPNYAHFKGDETRIAKEVLATLIGMEARDRIKVDGLGSKLVKWIHSLWITVRNMIASGHFRALNIDEFKRLAIGDILSDSPVNVSRYSLYRNPESGENTIVSDSSNATLSVDSELADVFEEIVESRNFFEETTPETQTFEAQDTIYEKYLDLQGEYGVATDNFLSAPDELLRNNALNELNRIGSELNISEISISLRLPMVPAVQEGMNISERIC